MHIVFFYRVFICFLSPFLSVDLVPADTAAADYDYAPDDQRLVDPAFAAEQPGKQTPMTHAFVT